MDNQTTSQRLKMSQNIMKSDRVIALLGVASYQRQSKVSACPSDNQITAFINGELTGESRQMMLAHFNTCPTCYYNWLETLSHLHSLKPKESGVVEQLSKWKQAWAKRLFPKKLISTKWESAWVNILYFPKVLIPVTITAIFMIVIWLIQSPTLNSQINNGFEMATTFQSVDTSKQLLANLSSETTILGIAEPDVPRGVQAFSVGVEMGRAILTNTKPQDDSIVEIAAKVESNQWQNEYELGRWFVLLWTMAQTPEQTSTDFWLQQQATGENLQARFKQRSPTDEITEVILNKMLNPVMPLLAQLQQGSDVHLQLTEHLGFAIWGISSL